MSELEGLIVRGLNAFNREDLGEAFNAVLKKRSKLLSELFVIGITSRLRLDETQNLGFRAEQVRRDLEDLASELERRLSDLPRKYEKTRRNLKGIAALCNGISARFSEINAS